MATAAGRREALAELVRDRQQASGDSRRRLARIAGMVAAVAALIGLVIWLFGPARTPPELRAVQAAVDAEMARLAAVARNEQPFDGDSGMGTIMQQMRTVPREQREQAWREMGRLYEARETAAVNSFFALPAAERQAELDRRIRAEDERRQAREAAWAAARERASARSGERGGGGRGGERGTNERGGSERGGSPWAGRSSQAGGAGGPQTGGQTTGGGGAPAGRGAWTEESRNDRSKSAIDRTSPEQRARRAEYRRLVAERRAQMGQPQGRR
jgi:hypothetical protein